MRRIHLVLLIPVAVALTYACSSSDNSSSQASDVLDPSCVNDTSNPPKSLLCTGLYKSVADLQTKTVAGGIQPYAPATPLWSDGAEKSRWIKLPSGQTIDASDPNEWKFPVGTTAWKEFKVAGKRIETRMWRKVSTQSWVNATYAWNADESAATYSEGGDIAGPAGTYHIPTNDECQECHRGRTDRLLGFENVSLGLDGATGYTLPQLVADGKLSPAPASTSLSVGDDGTGQNVAAMRWLHVNCGVACHNSNSNSFAYAAGMNLRLDPTTLDGSSTAGFADRTTTLNVAAKTPTWLGQPRIVPGDPDSSLLYQLISHRGDGNQMPPIASLKVDDADVALVRAWIAAMGPAPADAGTDAAAPNDAGAPDDASVDEAGMSDAGTDASDDGAVSDAGTGGTDAGALCEPGSVQEAEVNDTPAAANMMQSASGSFCGRLTPGDTDYFTFAMPAATTSWTITDRDQGGNVVITGTVNGQTFTLGSGGSYPFFPGMTYTFEATAPGATTDVDYELVITVSP